MPSEFEELFGEWGKDAAGTPLPLSVETYMGTGSRGPVYDVTKSRPGLIQLAQNRLVRSSAGNEVVSSSLVYAPIAMAGDFPLHSRVTLADGRVAAVLTVGKPDVYGLLGFVVLNLE